MHIEIDEIAKSFGPTTALHPVSLSIPSGALIALLGPSGSGKTTLLRILGGLEFPTSGRVLFDGQDATGLTVQERRAGFVFQSYALFRHMTVFENVAYGLRARPRSTGSTARSSTSCSATARSRSPGSPTGWACPRPPAGSGSGGSNNRA